MRFLLQGKPEISHSRDCTKRPKTDQPWTHPQRPCPPVLCHPQQGFLSYLLIAEQLKESPPESSVTLSHACSSRRRSRNALFKPSPTLPPTKVPRTEEWVEKLPPCSSISIEMKIGCCIQRSQVLLHPRNLLHSLMLSIASLFNTCFSSPFFF